MVGPIASIALKGLEESMKGLKPSPEAMILQAILKELHREEELLSRLIEEIVRLRRWLVPSKGDMDFVDLTTNAWVKFDKAKEATLVELRNAGSQDVEYAYDKNERKVNALPAGDRHSIQARPGVIWLRRTSTASSPRVFIEWWEP